MEEKFLLQISEEGEVHSCWSGKETLVLQVLEKIDSKIHKGSLQEIRGARSFPMGCMNNTCVDFCMNCMLEICDCVCGWAEMIFEIGMLMYVFCWRGDQMEGEKWLLSTGMGLDDFWFAPSAPGGAQARESRRKSRPAPLLWRPGARCSQKIVSSLFLIVYGVSDVRFGRFLSRFGGFEPFRNCW
ncbi:hypothetical protein LR48_Vigan02g214800 [Vigna angularis]|uniref:Uncharacterized protein n=1 Tax=Phaseolus angularis TaxID=3914 RepID=A0A0L9TZJ2_PHAAN|nr:hypothetical protein LR48_Vigan02g214800 [Vigna angularis]